MGFPSELYLVMSYHTGSYFLSVLKPAGRKDTSDQPKNLYEDDRCWQPAAHIRLEITKVGVIAVSSIDGEIPSS